MRILAAEDNFITRLDLREILIAAGHEVCAEARDGIEAIALARSSQPDIVILDVSMPRLDGLAAARRIAEEHHIPIVMVTGRRHADLAAEAVASGLGASYLAKPFSERDVLAAIDAAARAHRKAGPPSPRPSSPPHLFARTIAWIRHDTQGQPPPGV